MTVTAVVVHPSVDGRVKLVKALQAAGLEVASETSFARAARLIDRLQPDVLVTALKLDSHNGLHLAIRARHTTSRTRVLVVGYPDADLEREALAAGATYLTRFEPGEVARTALRLLDHSACNRRWRRLAPPAALAAEWNGIQVQLTDVSYEGVRIDIATAAATALHDPRRLCVPAAGVAADTVPVWVMDHPETGHIFYGASLRTAPAAEAAWREFVDSIGRDAKP
jgi:DNA-binding response OmpR family regulator